VRHGFGKTGFIILFTLFIFPAMLSAQNNIIPDILDRRDFNCDFGSFTDRAVENLDRYSPGWDRDYPSTSPAIATRDMKT